MLEYGTMGENPRFRKVIERPDLKIRKLLVGGEERKVKYTGKWEEVDGGKNVSCRTWKMVGKDGIDVDGADIKINRGWTPIQLVVGAEVVFDVPENGQLCCVVMDTDGQIFVNPFNETDKGEMHFEKGMIITWIAKTEARLTEFETPSFNDEMFVTVPENEKNFQGRDMTKFFTTVGSLRKGVK